ncbi:Heterokaryon incompatibility protein 6, OR allele [Fusarium oxysporum f. sp. raphani]|uniref:Heterokaryon incompatibility protein 6, OR allele n=1 Tax=Fusarium oxysporum f. sp. raphani TaxID=96318 RepID=A0A8J5PDT7_FUSOX|nr:Heterokaryon incompatibility protein 6, OR allele [Fusarium oxysporum f. sp. raphani]
MSEVNRPQSGAYQSYSPLPEGKWTRILILDPGARDDPIECSLHVAKFDTEAYDAISYVWGNAAERRSIQCQGHQVDVTTNLFEALRQIRHPREPRHIWADALCINQSDLVEKSFHVNMMGDIYAHAQQVVVCLGDDGQNGEVASVAFSVIQDYNRIAAKYLSDDVLNSRKWWKPDDGYGPVTATRLQNVLPLFKHPWFERVWVLQEVGLAKNVVLAYGSSMMDFAEVMDFVQAWAQTGNSFPGVYFRSGHISNLFSYIWSSYVKDVEDAWFRSSRILKVLFQQSLKRSKLEFLDVLFRARHIQKATDLRDFVYAFLGHPRARSDDGELLVKADYSRNLSQLRLQLFSGLSPHSLRFLGLVSHRLPEELASGPSWCPQLDVSRAWAINGRYEACPGEDPTSEGWLSPRVDGSSLELCLYLIDTIDFCGEVAARERSNSNQATISTEESGHRIAESMLVQRPSLAETYWSVLEESEKCHGLTYQDKMLAFAILHNSAKITVRPYIPISMITTGWSDGAREDRRSIIYRSDSERQTVYKGRDSSPLPKDIVGWDRPWYSPAI